MKVWIPFGSSEAPLRAGGHRRFRGDAPGAHDRGHDRRDRRPDHRRPARGATRPTWPCPGIRQRRAVLPAGRLRGPRSLAGARRHRHGELRRGDALLHPVRAASAARCRCSRTRTASTSTTPSSRRPASRPHRRPSGADRGRQEAHEAGRATARSRSSASTRCSASTSSRRRASRRCGGGLGRRGGQLRRSRPTPPGRGAHLAEGARRLVRLR